MKILKEQKANLYQFMKKYYFKRVFSQSMVHCHYKTPSIKIKGEYLNTQIKYQGALDISSILNDPF